MVKFFKNGCIVSSLFYFSSATAFANSNIYDPLQDITWTQVKDYGNVQDIGSGRYLDVISHTDPNDPDCPRSSGMAFSQPSIRVHETQHMLHYQIQKLSGKVDGSVQGIYFQNGNGVVLTNPKTKVTDFIPMIPAELQEDPSPYQTYFVEQMQFPSLNNIGYLFNEWASYISNITLNLQLEKAGAPEADEGGHAANFSPHFFGYLAIALQHLATAEPTALNDKQLKAVFALCAQSTWELMHDALSSSVFGRDDTMEGSRIHKLMDFYRNSPNFADARNTLITIYGKDWVTQLMQ